jgi:hypothetical protein
LEHADDRLVSGCRLVRQDLLGDGAFETAAGQRGPLDG